MLCFPIKTRIKQIHYWFNKFKEWKLINKKNLMKLKNKIWEKL